MIPKTIHYCWFGKKSKNDLINRCIESWKEFCPDFELKEWNESNTQTYQNKFYKDAYRKKKYAFVADCVRAQALYEFGGVYLDTDMLLLKPIDVLLSNDFFTAYEVGDRAAYGLFGAIAGHRFLKQMKEFYDTTEFNEFSLPVITHTFKLYINKANLGENDRIFPPEYFYPLSYENKDEDYNQFITSNSYAVHLWGHSWNDKEGKRFCFLIKGLKTVTIDYLFYGYSKQYFIRYFRGFSRQLYYYVFKGKVK
ncbi:MAG: mannosyltransferase [Bacteroidetes bacterium]|nr:MAG: mannosyltransferase [Bacteroidota bacterium]